MAWNDDRVAQLKKLWMAGRSASQIAAELKGGLTRSAVIGKVHRLGLSKHGRAACACPAPNMRKRVFAAPKPARPSAPATKRPTPTVGAFVVNGWGKQQSTPARQNERAAEGRAITAAVTKGGGVQSPNARPWMEARKPNECNWTIGDRYEIKFCCNPVHARGWCLGHYALGTVPTAPVRPRAAAAYSRFDAVETVKPEHGRFGKGVGPLTAQTLWDAGRDAA